MVKKTNKKGNMGAVALVGIALVGGYIFMQGGGSVTLPQNNVESSDAELPQFYVSSLTAGDGNYTITSSGSGADIKYLIEVDADTIGNGARTDTFDLKFTQNVAGMSSESTIENYQTIYVAPRSDLEMSDTSDNSHTMIDVSGSTIAGSKTSKVLTMQGATETATQTLSLSVNPQAVDWGTLVDVNDVGESKIIPLDFGQSNTIELKIKE